VDVAQGGAMLTPVGLPDEAAQITEKREIDIHSKSSRGNRNDHHTRTNGNTTNVNNSIHEDASLF
jgi:hypothetical protein